MAIIEPQPLSDLAIATLKHEMLFYRDKAEELIAKIIDALKESNANGMAISMMYKHASEAKKLAIDCAAKLAPYESPRLQSIEVKNEVTHKFVIEAPKAFDNEQAWLENVNKEYALIAKIKKEAAEDIEVINP